MATVTVTVPPRNFAQDDLSNVENADFLAKAQEAGLASDAEITAAVAPVAAAQEATQDQLDAYELATDADILALQEGQGTAAVTYNTWAELDAHPTGSLVTGTPGSVLNDAGTHTDPVVGGTVDNEGTYSYVSGDGWQWLSELQSKLAEDAADVAVAAAVGVRGPKNLVTSGLIATWGFDEGYGDTVDNLANPGTLDIDLAGPTNPNVTRTGRGVEMVGGLVETPSLTNARTIVYLMRTGYGESSGFLLSGGTGSGDGILGTILRASWPTHIGGGWGVHPASAQPGAPNAGLGCFEMTRGGYVLMFVEFDSAYTTKIGFGGMHSATTNRCTEAGLRWAAAYTSQLTDDERQQIYDSVSEWSARNGVILSHATAPKVVDGAIICGESTAEGFSFNTGLSAAEQATRYTNVKMIPANGSALWLSSDELQLGYNQRTSSQSTLHGPEIGLGLAKRGAGATSKRELWLCKMAQGSTYLAPSDGGTPPAGVNGPTISWNTDEWRFLITHLFQRLLAHIYRWEQDARLQGVGIEVKLIEFLIGLNDVSLDASLIADAATYEGWLQDFYDDLMTYTGLSDVKMHLPRAHNHDPSYNATTGPRVRQGQADFATANSSVVQLMDTDALPLEADSVHFTAAAMKTITAAGYAWGGL